MSVLNNKIIRTNLLSIITACVNIALFRYAYTSYLVPVWGYMGFQNNGTTLTQSAIVNLIVIFPILFYSTRKVISNFISVLLYCFAYVPIVIALDYYYIDFVSVLPYFIAANKVWLTFNTRLIRDGLTILLSIVGLIYIPSITGAIIISYINVIVSAIIFVVYYVLYRTVK